MESITAYVSILFTSVCVFVVALQAECPPGWSVWRDSCYILLPERMNWLGAAKACKRRGSSMIVPNTKEEHSFIWQEMKPQIEHLMGEKPNDDYKLWIGCIVKVGCFGDAGFTGYINNWNDDGHSSEDCIRMADKDDYGDWGDSDSDKVNFAACEMQISPRRYWLTADADGRFKPQCLLNHEIKNLTANGVIGCGQACWAEPRCHSFNFWQQKKICQLNGAIYLQADITDFIFVDGCYFFSL